MEPRGTAPRPAHCKCAVPTFNTLTPTMMEPNTTCATCQLPFYARQSELNRGCGKYCSKPCTIKGTARAKTKVRIPNVTCAYCQTDFYVSKTRKTNSKSSLFFCCRAHKDISQRLGGISAIQPPHYGTATYQDAETYRTCAFSNNPAKCDQCGYDRYKSVLEVHHIDHNRANNSITNLRILCPTCHTEHHFLTSTGRYSKGS